MDYSTPFLNVCNGSAPPKNSSAWKSSSPTTTPHASKSSAAVAAPLSSWEKVYKALSEPWKRIVLSEELFGSPGAEETPQRLAELDAAVQAACQQDPQRMVAATDAEMLATRCRDEIAAIGKQRRETQTQFDACPKKARVNGSPLPRLWGKDANWPMAIGLAACGVGATGFFGVELANATVLALTASWPFTDTPWTALLFTSAFVAGPFGLLWWGEASAPPRFKRRLTALRRVTSIAVGAMSVVAFGLAVGLEHGEVMPAYGEPEPWGVPLPLLTVLSVSMLALLLLAAKSGATSCWDRLRGVAVIDNPRREELRLTLQRLDNALAEPNERAVPANKLAERLQADLVANQQVARQRLRKAIAEASAQSRRRDAERRLCQAQADMDRQSE